VAGEKDGPGMNMENRLDARLADLARQSRGALIPYVTGAYPDLEVTGRLIQRFDDLGAGAVEVGFPFSDSIADGPVIQDSFHRVLAGRHSVDEIFACVAKLREQVAVPLVAMVSYSIVKRIGLQRFVKCAAGSGFDGLITPDVPIEEAAPIAEAAEDAGLKHIMLVATSTPPERCGRIAALCTGFVYQIAVAGITGERDRLADDLTEHVQRLRQATNLPVCVGFGIGSADQVRQVCAISDGVIVGSAIVRRITEAVDAGRSGDQIVEEVAAFVGDLMAAT
jgi:tryptophan synthase alpha chain